MTNIGKNIPNEVLRKYLGTTSYSNPEKLIIYDETDEQFEMNATMISNLTHRVIKSKYNENVMINDHTSVWGSWFSKILGWGYYCCYNINKNSYCLGSNAKEKILAK